ncbi:thioredoxin-dependent thiol peroxidase [Candidatus Azambacteria bacterium]|nr:thioredoxin-dependent thiol peroxidase [Candidatus Azambacteria bacterium]
MKELKEGDKAPNFILPSSSGKDLSLSDLAGKRVVLYFYPKDMTPGCTAEAQNFRDLYGKFKKAGAVVFGVSPDSIKSHLKFIEKESLSFELLSDEDHSVLEAYGVWKEKSMYGRKYMGVERSTFIINENGVIDKIYRKISVSGHAEDMLKVCSASY